MDGEEGGRGERGGEGGVGNLQQRNVLMSSASVVHSPLHPSLTPNAGAVDVV